MANMSPEDLLRFASSERHREVVQAVIAHGSNNKASKVLGCGRRTVDRLMKRLEARAATKAVAPHRSVNKETMEGFEAKRISTAYKGDTDEVALQWVIQEREKGYKPQLVIDAIEDFQWKAAPVIPKAKGHNSELLTLYTLTDFHLGMYAAKSETGDSWDIGIAEHEALSAITRMADGSPESEIAILNLQGDFLHWDGLLAVTPASKHVLDASGRFCELIEMALSVTLACIEILLRKHKTVKLLVCEGNHDESSSAWLRKAAKVIYRDNKRMIVDDTDFPYYAHLHGEIMLGFHHGHKKKNTALPTLFASEPRYRQMWGSASYCYIHTGHYHHTEQDMSEGGGAIVERHPTLSGRDAYAARGGYTSWRAAHAITYHNQTGECLRVTVTPNVRL